MMNTLNEKKNQGLAPTKRVCILLLLLTVITSIIISIVFVSTCRFVGNNDDDKFDTTGNTTCTGIVSILFHHLYYYHSTNKITTSISTGSSNHVSDKIFQSISDRHQQEHNRQHHQQQQQQQNQYQQQKELYITNKYKERMLQTAFGTQSGYDVGGKDSICWITTISDTTLYNTTISNSTTGSTTGSPSTDTKGSYTLLDNHFAQSTFDTTKLLPNCYNGTTLMTVQPLNETEFISLSDSYYYTNTSYTYNVTVQIDIQYLFNNSQSNDTNSLLQHLLYDKSNTSKITIRSEYILCNAIRMGFCHPSRIHKDSIYNPVTDTNTSSTQQAGSPEIVRYQNGQIINGIGIDNQLIRSPWIEWDIHRFDNLNTTAGSTSTIFTSSINVLFSFPIGITPGAYFFIGHSVLYYYDTTDDNRTTIMKRLDIADAIPDNIIEIKDEPIIIYMTYGMKVFLSCIIGFFSIIALSMFIFIMYNMKHIVMQLTQGPFLAAITLACFIKIVCTVTYFPINDTFCSISTIVISVPQTLIGSIVVARLWRAYSTLHVVTRFARRSNNNKKNNNGQQLVESLLLRFLNTLANPMSIITKITSICKKCTRRSDNNIDSNDSTNTNLRRTVVARESIVLIIMLVLPQLLVQIVALIINHSYLIIDYRDNIQSGRAICAHHESWQLYFSLTYLIFIYIIAIILAYMSKDLPSVFNEKDDIFTVAFIDAFIGSTSLALQAVLNVPSTTPNMMVLTNVCIAIAMSVNSLYFIIYPKIKRVIQNETIIVSNMLGTNKPNKYNNDNSNATTTTTTTTGNAAPAVSGTACNGTIDTEQGQQQEQQSEHNTGNINTTNGALTLSTETISSLPPVDNNNSTNHHPHLSIRNGDPVPASIEKQLHLLQIFLRDITDNLCDGLTLSQEEWQCLKDDVSCLQNSLGTVEIADM